MKDLIRINVSIKSGSEVSITLPGRLKYHEEEIRQGVAQLLANISRHPTACGEASYSPQREERPIHVQN